jgi:ribA/ribD-fused uncharacterized protein
MSVYSLDQLITEIRSGKKFNYVYFWGHSAQGGITKSCLSQWYPSAFVLDGKKYATAEHYMMAAKARLFSDVDIERKILDSTDPSQAKALGRCVKNFSDSLWKEQCFEIVVKGNKEKFSQNRELKIFLLSTGNKILVEASPVDRIWGIGFAESAVEVNNPELWQGLNLLGFTLMKVRDELIQEV